jgi:glycosyltransferase involved in cell wall biosynthesis
LVVNIYYEVFMKIALVHDQISEFGGAERVLLAMSEIWPEAPIYTAYAVKGSPAWERFKTKDIRVSWMQPLARFASPLRFLASTIWNSFDFSQYDIILGSSSWYITKGFTKKGDAIEICYCHTPPRWLYGYPTSMNWQKYRLVRAYATIVGFFMRQYDFEAAQRANYFIANSKETQKRIQKFYRRDSTIIYPPVDLPRVPNVKKENYYLFVSRPVGGKGLELAVAATKKLGVPLKIVGARGGQHVSDLELAKLYAGAKAFLALATDEDFGMTPVEAMAAGTPVIAFDGGGYRESVIDGKTGVLFHEDLISAIRKFENMKFLPKDCINQAKKFSNERFRKEMKSFVTEKFRSASR